MDVSFKAKFSSLIDNVLVYVKFVENIIDLVEAIVVACSYSKDLKFI